MHKLHGAEICAFLRGGGGMPPDGAARSALNGLIVIISMEMHSMGPVELLQN